jgi:hypothetical protein
VCCNEVKRAVLPAIDIAKRGFADAGGFLQDRLKDPLKLAGGRTDQAKHLGGGRLLLQCLMQFAGQPSDETFLAHG